MPADAGAEDDGGRGAELTRTPGRGFSYGPTDARGVLRRHGLIPHHQVGPLIFCLTLKCSS